MMPGVKRLISILWFYFQQHGIDKRRFLLGKSDGMLLKKYKPDLNLYLQNIYKVKRDRES